MKPSHRPLLALGLALLGAGCAHSSTAEVQTARGICRAGTPASVNIAMARERGRPPLVKWRPYSAAALAEARRDRKLVLIDGAAEWCHWCHVMDATTYRDPAIGRLLAERFVTIRFDADAHPDLAERYGPWGWPATILLSPDAEEVGKHQGYLPPDEMARALAEAVAAAQRTPSQTPESGDAGDVTAPVEALPWIAGRALVDMDAYYDVAEGGWGRRQKAPIGANVEIELSRAAHGDKTALDRAVFTLRKQRALLDPVWGGVYQYSSAGTWNEPHYEKLMTYQAANLEAYARTYAKSGDKSLLADAQRIASYMNDFLSNAEGAFLVSQDADVGAHDERATFVDGDVYYRRSDRERRALGIPRVDDHVYPFENGIAIAAFVTLFEASRDPAALARARRGADHIRAKLVGPDGSVRRSAEGPRYLSDAASFGRALARLAEATGEATYRDAAIAVAEAMRRDLEDPATGAFWDRTPERGAIGVFARRTRSLAPNAMAARFFAALFRVTGDAVWKDRGRRVLAGAGTPRAMEDRGRMVGEILLAFDELGVVPWNTAAPAR